MSRKYKLKHNYPNALVQVGSIIEYVNDTEMVVNGKVQEILVDYKEEDISSTINWVPFLFMSKDGKEIYEGDIVWSVSQDRRERCKADKNLPPEVYKDYAEANKEIISYAESLGFVKGVKIEIYDTEKIETVKGFKFFGEYDTCSLQIITENSWYSLEDCCIVDNTLSLEVDESAVNLIHKLSNLCHREDKTYKTLGEEISKIIKELSEDNKKDFFAGLKSK